MIKNWPRKLTFIGLGASLILWTSGKSIIEATEPYYSSYSPSSAYEFWSVLHDWVEARYLLATFIAVTIFGAYHMFARKDSN